RKTPASPEAYAVLASEIERIRPAFNQGVADLAERYLVFLALEPMAAHLDQPLEQQMNALGLTVWPTALHVDPQQGEAVQAYLERACAGPLATDCKYVVPEAWPIVLGAIVWKRMKTRARDAYSSCSVCTADRTYGELLEKYDQSETRMARLR